MDSSHQQSGGQELIQTPTLHGIIFGSLNSEQVDYGEMHSLAMGVIGNLIDAGSTYDQICEELKIIRIDIDAVQESCNPEKLRRLYDLIAILAEEIAESLRIPRETALQKFADIVPLIQEDQRGVQASISNVRSGINLRALLCVSIVIGVIAAGAGAGVYNTYYRYRSRVGEIATPDRMSALRDPVIPSSELTSRAIAPEQQAPAVESTPQQVTTPVAEIIPPQATPAASVSAAGTSSGKKTKAKKEDPASAAIEGPAQTITIPVTTYRSDSSSFKVNTTDESRVAWERMGYKVSVSMGFDGKKIIKLTDSKGNIYQVRVGTVEASTTELKVTLQSFSN